MSDEEFPKYLMKVGENRHFYSLSQAAEAYNNGMTEVDFGRYVLNADFSVRKMNAEDQQKISTAADNLEAAK